MTHAEDRQRLAPEVTRGAFPMLATFLRGYLHQDWALDYESPQQARDVFLADASVEERAEYAREAQRITHLVSAMSLRDVTTLLTDRLGGHWIPESLDDVLRVLLAGSRDEEVDL